MILRKFKKVSWNLLTLTLCHSVYFETARGQFFMRFAQKSKGNLVMLHNAKNGFDYKEGK